MGRSGEGEPVSERMSEHASFCLHACLGGLVTCMLKWSEWRGRPGGKGRIQNRPV